MDESVALVGSGPAVAAIEAALSDVGVEYDRTGIEDVTERGLSVVVGDAGDGVFERADPVGTWIAVERGGMGGHPLSDVDATVSVLGESPCFRCLRTRVAANHEASGGSGTADASDARLAGAVAGRLAVAALDGEDADGRVIELPYTERLLRPVPGCSCGGVRDRTPRRDHEEASVAEAADRIERAVDDRVGIVSEIGEIESFPAPYYLAVLSNTEPVSDAEVERHAAGVASDWDGALVKAVGEALERYAAGVYREADFETGAPVETADAVPPSSFVLPEEGYESPDPDEPIAWVEGADLIEGQEVRLPAEFVHFPPHERRHKPSITTGLALGSSGVDALLSGLYETIERDATTIAWYSTFDPLELDVEDGAFDALVRRARSEELEVTPLLVTQDVDVPVVSVAVHHGAWPRFAVGSAADLDPAGAARNALCEALQNWMELRRMGPERAEEESTAIGRYADFPREAEAFLDSGGEVSAAHLASDADRSGEAELDAVLDRLDGAGLSAYASRLTTRDLEGLGFEAVRVLVPEAQPRFVGERYFGERARTVPRELGYRPRFDRAAGPYP